MRGLVVVLSCLLLQGAIPAHAQVAGGSASGAFTAGAEALFWWFNDSPAPVPLVTNGVLGVANTQTYLGGAEPRHRHASRRPRHGRVRASRRARVRCQRVLHAVPHDEPQREFVRQDRLDQSRPSLHRRRDTGAETGTELSYRADVQRQRKRRSSRSSLLGAEFDGGVGAAAVRGVAIGRDRRLPLPAAARDVHVHDQQPVHSAVPGGHLEHDGPVREPRTTSTARRRACARASTRDRGSAPAPPRSRSAAWSRRWTSAGRSSPTTTPATDRRRRSPAATSRFPPTSATTRARSSRWCPK